MPTRTGRPAATSVFSARSGKRFLMSLGRLALLAPAPLVGGQAVMEGVMMRNGDVYALAVRTPDGAISVERRPWFSLTRSAWLKKPFLRGFPTLIETLVNGIKALNLSAERTTEGTGEEIKGWQLAVTLVASLLFAVGLFVVVPHLLSVAMNWLGFGGDVDGISFHIWDGLFKFLLFVHRRLQDTFLTIISDRYLITNITKLHVSFFTVHFRHISDCTFYILLHSRYQRRPVLIILNSGLQNSHQLFVSRHIPLITADKTCCKYCKTSQ